jgi:ABC-type glutathione transport system ATPase component
MIAAQPIPLLQVDDLSISYVSNGSDRLVLKAVNLDVGKGETVGVTGESGCGKTTMALALLRLLPSNAQVRNGRIMFSQQDLLELDRNQLNQVRGREIGFVFQEPLTALNPVMRIEAQVCEGMRHHLGLSKDAARMRAIDLLSKVGIADGSRCLEAYPHQISGGMRQRVLIASALCCEPKLLICDEPSSSLDRPTQFKLMETMVQLKESQNLSILLISHDLEMLEGVADRVVVMAGGVCREWTG